MEEMDITEFDLKGIKLVLREDETEIARARLYLIYNDLHERPYALFEDLFVLESHRGKGLGKKMIQKVIELAKQKKCYKIIGTSRYSRENVHAIYQKYGFKDYGSEFRMDLE